MRVEKINTYFVANCREITFKEIRKSTCEFLMKCSCFFGCALLYLEITLSRKKQRENDKEDTFNISSCDKHQ